MKTRTKIIGNMLKIETGLNILDMEGFKKYKLSLLEIRTLAHINEKKNSKPGDLAKEFMVTPATMTVQIDRLVKKGYVEKIVDKDDRRAVNLMLTPTGKKNLREIVSGKLKSYDIVFNSLTEKEQLKLLELMEKILKALEGLRK